MNDTPASTSENDPWWLTAREELPAKGGTFLGREINDGMVIPKGCTGAAFWAGVAPETSVVAFCHPKGLVALEVANSLLNFRDGAPPWLGQAPRNLSV